MAQKQKKGFSLGVVPKEDEPYDVPENWLWVRLGDVIKSLKDKTDIFENDTKYVSLENIEKNTGKISFQSAQEVKSTKSIFHNGDILYGRLRPYLNKHGLATFDGICSTDILIFKANEFSFNRFVNYFFNLTYFIGYAVSNSKGINLPRVSEGVIFDIPFPLPPLPEQKRIVNIIESLFKNLDEAKEKLLKVKKGFGERKAALLHKAFTGELTEKWRERNGVGVESWEALTLNDVADYKKGPFGSSITKAMFVPKGENTFKVYEQGNAIRKTIEYGHYYITEKKYTELKNFSVKSGDIIISCAGTIGEIYKLPDNCEDGVINQALMRVRLYQNIEEKFFSYHFEGIIKSDVIEQSNGTAIKNIPPFKVLKAMKISLPTLPEQKEIVRILDAVLSAEKDAEQKIDIVLNDIELLKKTILARAFRGELGTNDPKEENATATKQINRAY